MGSLALKEEHSGVKPFGLLRDEMVARRARAGTRMASPLVDGR